jgi:hypothetical protein
VKTAVKTDTARNATSQFTFKVSYASTVEMSPFPNKLDKVQFDLLNEKKSESSTVSYSVRSNLITKVKYPINAYDNSETRE